MALSAGREYPDSHSNSYSMVDAGCSMPVLSYVTFILISVNTFVNVIVSSAKVEFDIE